MTESHCPHCHATGAEFEAETPVSYRPIVSSFIVQRLPNLLPRRTRCRCLNCLGTVLIDLEARTIEAITIPINEDALRTILQAHLSDTEQADEPIDVLVYQKLRDAGIVGLTWLSTHKQARSAVLEQLP